MFELEELTHHILCPSKILLRDCWRGVWKMVLFMTTLSVIQIIGVRRYLRRRWWQKNPAHSSRSSRSSADHRDSFVRWKKCEWRSLLLRISDSRRKISRTEIPDDDDNNDEDRAPRIQNTPPDHPDLQQIIVIRSFGERSVSGEACCWEYQIAEGRSREQRSPTTTTTKIIIRRSEDPEYSRQQFYRYVRFVLSYILCIDS